MTFSVTKNVIGFSMSKEKSRLNKYFIIKKDHSSEKKMLYDPPLLAESRNIRVELRKEKKMLDHMFIL